MTMHQTIPDPAQGIASAQMALAPERPGTLPVAPLAMPKQVLTQDRGLWRRAVAFVRTRIGWVKPGTRHVS